MALILVPVTSASKDACGREQVQFFGLADLSDAANPSMEYDEAKDARDLMKISLNGLNLFHYQAMSLDHPLLPLRRLRRVQHH